MRSTRGQIKMKVHYWNAGSFEVHADGKKVDPTPFDKNIGASAELSGYRGCGENRYVGVKNYLEFIMTPYCLIEIKPVDAILSNVRMSWTMDEFYDSGGVTSFVDRVSAALGIHASQMKIVAVYQGSVVVDYQIQAAQDNNNNNNGGNSAVQQTAAQQLRNIESTLNTLVESSNTEVFGAPVLSASTNGQAVIEDPTYNPAAAPITPTTPVKAEKEDETEVLTNSDLTINIDETTRNSLIAIIGVLVLIIACCFGCGVFVVCTYSLGKAAKEISDVQQKHAQNQ